MLISDCKDCPFYISEHPKEVGYCDYADDYIELLDECPLESDEY